MATKAKKVVLNVKSYTIGSDIYEGVTAISIDANLGEFLPVLKEGHLYPTAAYNAGTKDAPVKIRVSWETDCVAMMAALGAARGTHVIVATAGDASGDFTITLAGTKFTKMADKRELQKYGMAELEGHCVSADGTAFPMSVAGPA